MDRQDAIKVLEMVKAYGLAYEAKKMAISNMRKMQYLTGRPCEVCSCHDEKGCGVWECMFDAERSDT